VIVESAVLPRTSAAPCADRLILGEHVLGVADGATGKPWDSGPDGATLAEAVAGHLAATAAGTGARVATDGATGGEGRYRTSHGRGRYTLRRYCPPTSKKASVI
jgi:hypothetical protein